MIFDAKYVIIGGGIAGTAAAEVLRKEDRDARIIIVCDEPHTLYSRVLLTKPNFFLGKIPFERIFLKDDKWYDDRRIELWRKRRATRLDHKTKTIVLDNGEELRYEKLLLAIGSTPRRLPIPGMDKKGVYTLRTVDQTKEIIEAVKRAKKGVAIGGGVIGFEMAEMMQLSGMDVTFIIIKPHYRIGFLGKETSKTIEAAIEKTGVKIMRNSETVEILGGDTVEGVRLKDGTEITCDFVIVGIGTVIPVDFLKETGVKIDHGILANEYLETNIPDIWTAGDCAEYYDSIIEDRLKLGNWANAQAQGQTAAKNILGHKEPYKYVSFFTTHGFGKAMTYVGDMRQDKEGRDVILRGSPKDDTHARIVIENNRVVGALIINSSHEVDGFCKLIEGKIDVSDKLAQLKDTNIDLKTLANNNMAYNETKKNKKIKVGWFSFSCCEDSTIVFTELLNDHWKEWKELFDFRHARVLKSRNIMDEFDVAFIEGAIASDKHEKKLKDIRSRAKVLVAVGSCACIGMPSAQRNHFSPEQLQEVQFLIDRFKMMPKVLKVSDVVKVDYEVPGCPMNPDDFVNKVGIIIKELKGAQM